MLEKRKQRQKRAKEREMVKCAARRGIIFGFMVEPGHIEDTSGRSKQGKEENPAQFERSKCEAVMLGKVVEPSFAKGDWSIRWRE